MADNIVNGIVTDGSVNGVSTATKQNNMAEPAKYFAFVLTVFF